MKIFNIIQIRNFLVFFLFFTIFNNAKSQQTGIITNIPFSVGGDYGGFQNIESISLDVYGNLLIGDNNRIEGFNIQNRFISLFFGSYTAGYSGDGGLASKAVFDNPRLTEDIKGNIYVASPNVHRVRKIDTNGIIKTIAGSGSTSDLEGGFSGDGGPALQAQLNHPVDVALDAHGNLFVADYGNHRIRKINPNGIITTIAGTGIPGYSGDNGDATKAQLNHPIGLAVDIHGNLYISESDNNRIRKVDTNGFITTVAGGGSSEYLGDGGPATSATLKSPMGIAVDSQDNLFIADAENKRVRMVSKNGIISTIAGTDYPFYDFSSSDGPALQTILYRPTDVAIDAVGNIFIADNLPETIWKLFKVASPGLIAGQQFPQKLLFGDINGDYKVNLSDVTLALQFLVGTITPTYWQSIAADLSPLPGTNFRDIGDGKIEISDVLTILRLAIGLIGSQDLLLPITITLDPQETNLLTAQEARIKATIHGTDYPSSTYKVNGIPGGNEEVGTVNSHTGYYRSPLTLSQGLDSVVISVTSNADPTKTASSIVHLQDTLVKNIRLIAYSPLDGSGHYGNVWVYKGYAYIGSLDLPAFPSVKIVNISDPTNLNLVGQLDTHAINTNVDGIKVIPLDTDFFKGDVALAALNGQTEGVLLWDVTDPLKTSILAQYNLPGGVEKIVPFVKDDRHYVALMNFDGTILDITDPYHPVKVTQFPFNTSDISFLEGSPLAAIVTKNSSRNISIYNFENIENPKFITNFGEYGGYNKEIIVTYGNNLMIVGNGLRGGYQTYQPPLGSIQFYDTSNLSQPKYLGYYNIEDGRFVERKGWYSFNDMMTDNDLLFTAFLSGGLRVINIKDPSKPLEVGYFVPPIISLTDKNLPSAPLVGSVYKYTDGYLYATDMNGGLYVLEYTGPKS